MYNSSDVSDNSRSNFKNGDLYSSNSFKAVIMGLIPKLKDEHIKPAYFFFVFYYYHSMRSSQ